jgi:hypothetical protein
MCSNENHCDYLQHCSSDAARVYAIPEKEEARSKRERGEFSLADCTAPSPSQSRNVYIAYIQVPVQALFTLCFKLSQALRIFILF